jgi:membrane-associated phospholipid phosphatase
MTEHAYAYSALPRRRDGGTDPSSSAAAALGVAVLCLLGMALTWLLAEHVTALQVRDAVLLRDFTELDRPKVASAGDSLLHLLEPSLFVLWAFALVAFAFARERPRVAAAVAAVLALAPLTADTLKPLLAHPHVQIEGIRVGAASWPSGHATAALSLALCAVLVAPPRLRAFVAIAGGLFVTAVAASLLILAWHMPSDVLGGFLVATLWTALAVAGLRLAEQRWPSRRGP